MDTTATGAIGRLPRRGLLGVGGLLCIATATGCNLLSTEPDRPGTGERPTGLRDMEPPELAAKVKAGKLPPLKDRLPDTPLVVKPVDEIGQYGGEWRTPIIGPGDLFRTIGYDQLLGWDLAFTKPEPNVAESVEAADDGKEYVIRLRRGIKWSDGEPFTADDIMFAYDDILRNEELSPIAPPWLVTEDQPATFEKLDDFAVRVLFRGPTGLFLQYLAAPEGEVLTSKPKHHLEKLHIKYNPDANADAESEGYVDWAEMFNSRAVRWENVGFPTLGAWILVEAPAEEGRAVADRNPYYWKVDPEGRQLPYIDRVISPLVENEELMLLQATNGEVDMHVRHFNNVTNKPILAASRDKGGYHFFNLINSYENQMVIALNLTHQDPIKREIFQNRDFRIGLSHAINRQEVIDVVFQRQGEPWQAAPRPESLFYAEEFAKQYTDFDIDLANRHLDRAGLSDRDGEDFRVGPDGARITFQVDVPTGYLPFFVDAMELIKKNWQDVGVDVSVRPMGRELAYERKEANLHDAVVWSGAAGLLDAIMDPRWYLPYSHESNFAIPWANWRVDGAEPKEEPPNITKQQLSIYSEARATLDDGERAELFRQVLQIAMEEFYVIGTVLPVGDYGIVKDNFHNVPETMPGGWTFPHPGPTKPEQYFRADS